ncbi:hypothetical protein BVRB_4g093790 [Beta vulgaris subsp. vulgaris]|nr:hypothetical protein BVRB_4g093790 [Beta vulgaris subsp. vulgaris]
MYLVWKVGKKVIYGEIWRHVTKSGTTAGVTSLPASSSTSRKGAESLREFAMAIVR